MTSCASRLAIDSSFKPHLTPDGSGDVQIHPPPLRHYASALSIDSNTETLGTLQPEGANDTPTFIPFPLSDMEVANVIFRPAEETLNPGSNVKLGPIPMRIFENQDARLQSKRLFAVSIEKEDGNWYVECDSLNAYGYGKDLEAASTHFVSDVIFQYLHYLHIDPSQLTSEAQDLRNFFLASFSKER